MRANRVTVGLEPRIKRCPCGAAPDRGRKASERHRGQQGEARSAPLVRAAASWTRRADGPHRDVTGLVSPGRDIASLVHRLGRIRGLTSPLREASCLLSPRRDIAGLIRPLGEISGMAGSQRGLARSVSCPLVLAGPDGPGSDVTGLIGPGSDVTGLVDGIGAGGAGPLRALAVGLEPGERRGVAVLGTRLQLSRTRRRDTEDGRELGRADLVAVDQVQYLTLSGWQPRQHRAHCGDLVDVTQAELAGRRVCDVVVGGVDEGESLGELLAALVPGSRGAYRALGRAVLALTAG